MDAATFRNDFPEFADAIKFPDARINFWLGLAQKLLPEDRWGDLRDYGLELFVAHQLSVEKRAVSGGVPGSSFAVVSSKSVGGVSVSYDTNMSLLQDAGFWNLSSYGVMFWQLARMIGAGGIQL